MPLTSEEHEKLYHYTTWAGVQGIIDTNTLWATHGRFLNDHSEIVGSESKLISYMEPVVRKVYQEVMKHRQDAMDFIEGHGGLDTFVKKDTRDIIRTILNAAGDEFYMASFCAHRAEKEKRHGLLSQWRGYGSDGGFALVFDTAALERLLKLEGARYEYRAGHCSTVVYGGSEDDIDNELGEDLVKIKYAVRAFLIFHNELDEGMTEEQWRKAIEDSFVPVVNVMTRWKHWGFKEENEVRAVFAPGRLDDRYRKLAAESGRSLNEEKEIKWGYCKPYIEVFDSPDLTLPIEQIIVGPHKDKDARAKALGTLLRNTDIDITISEIPYIGR